ncbi:hypothetical protein ACLK1S_21975 [Escherichia coli]
MAPHMDRCCADAGDGPYAGENGRHDEAFLARCTTVIPSSPLILLGESDGVAKTAQWAATIRG